jgi:undecaprenyl-diphosphatase
MGARFGGWVRQGGRSKWLLAGAAVSLVGYLGLAVLAERSERFDIDREARAWVLVLRHEAVTTPMQMVTRLGQDVGLVSLIALGSVSLWRLSRRWAIALPLVMAGTGLLQWLAKWASDRPRPDAAPWGFPSGHVLSLVVFFGLIVYLIATASRPRRRWRVLACLACMAPVVVVAASRLYLDRHWLSDLAGGLAIGLAYLFLVVWVIEVALGGRDAGPRPSSVV